MKRQILGNTRVRFPRPGRTPSATAATRRAWRCGCRDDNLVIFDAGTGIRGLGDALMATGRIGEGLPRDHAIRTGITSRGFPFFKPAFISGNEFTIIGAQSKGVTLRQMIASQMDKVYFPDPAERAEGEDQVPADQGGDHPGLQRRRSHRST